MRSTINKPAARANYFRIFKALPVIAAFSNRSLDLGFNCRNYPQNRKEFLGILGIDYADLVCAGQSHGTNVARIDRKDRGRIVADTDSLITGSKNIALAVFTADCLPIFIYDRQKDAAGLVHAGWRNTKDKIIQKTIGLMQEEIRSKVEDLVFAFGPAIRPCCYEIGPDAGRYFREGLLRRNNRLYLDLSAINKKQLFTLGIRDEQIEDSNICTSCSVDEFFSWRKEKEKAGRIMSVMMLRKEK